MRFGEMRNSFVVLFVVVGGIAFGTDGVKADRDYGETCFPNSTTLICDEAKFLFCKEFIPLIDYKCACDPEKALKNPSENTCIPFPVDIGADCSLFPDPDQNFCREVENTVCDGSTCVCGPDSIQIRNSCMKYVENIDEPCKHPLLCRIEGAYCHPSFSICLCDESTHTTLRLPGDEPKCLEYLESLGEACWSGLKPEHCSKVGANVICKALNSTDSVCECVDGYFGHEGNCVAFPQKLGDLCPPQGSECDAAVDGSICDSATSTCVCNPITHVTLGNSKCFLKAPILGGTCVEGTVPEHCSGIPGATCNSNLTCICDVNHFQMGAECEPLPTGIDGECVIDAHCSAIPNAICSSESKCQCDGANGWDFSDSEAACWKIPDAVGGHCEEDSNCRNVGNTTCSVDGMCLCSETFVPSVSNRECLPQVTKLNTSCVEDVQCRSGIGEESRCLEGSCGCVAGFVGVYVPTGPDSCLPVVGINGTCAVDAQCWDALGLNAKCDLTSALCVCNSDSSLLDSRCYRKASLESPCEFTEECVVGSNANAECRSGLCGCKSGKTMVYLGSCYGPTTIGGPCVDQIECALSINGTVSCSASSVCTCGRTSSLASDELRTCSGSSALDLSPHLLLLLMTFAIRPFLSISNLNK